jgi:hypothetical protein
MWAGLLASSCSADGIDDNNLIYVHSLEQMTAREAQLFKIISESTLKIENSAATFLHLSDDIATFASLPKEMALIQHLETLGIIQVMYMPERPQQENDPSWYGLKCGPTALGQTLYLACLASQ